MNVGRHKYRVSPERLKLSNDIRNARKAVKHALEQGDTELAKLRERMISQLEKQRDATP